VILNTNPPLSVILYHFIVLHNLQTERSFKLETAFRATYGSRDDGPNVTFISEYDALPEIGHACGHNLIAEVGVGSAVGVMAAMKAAGRPLGRVIGKFNSNCLLINIAVMLFLFCLFYIPCV